MTSNGKVGGSSISTVNFSSWANAPIVAPVSKTKKTKIKEIVNKIFDECAKFTEDPFWIKKFNSAAMGKFPTNFYFNDNILTYRKGAKNNNIILSNNPREAANQFMSFFHVNRGIFSPLDQQTALDLKYTRTQSMTNVEDLNWENSNKKTKERLISYFITDQAGIMNLTTKQSDQLKQTINSGLFMKYFDKNNIIVQNERIYSIGGLLWEPQSKTFYIDPNLNPTITRSYTKKKTTSNLPKDTVPQFGNKWDKYVNKYVDYADKQLYTSASQMSFYVNMNDEKEKNDEDNEDDNEENEENEEEEE